MWRAHSQHTPDQELEGPVDQAAVAELQDQDEDPVSDLEQKGEARNDEMADKEQDMDRALQDDVVEDEDQEQGCEVLLSSDEELPNLGLEAGMMKNVIRVKTFNARQAWMTLESKGLTALPRHVRGVSISYHAVERRWQGIYPGSTVGMSASWGGSTNRSEQEACLKAIRSVLQAHVAASPKDSMWAAQLRKVEAAEATGSF